MAIEWVIRGDTGDSETVRFELSGPDGELEVTATVGELFRLAGELLDFCHAYDNGESYKLCETCASVLEVDHISEAPEGVMATWWLSFTSPGRDGFLGACVVDVDQIATDLRDIADLASQLGCNPGGQVSGVQLGPGGSDSFRAWVASLPRGVLFDRATTEALLAGQDTQASERQN